MHQEEFQRLVLEMLKNMRGDIQSLRGEMVHLHTELKTDIKDLRIELKADIKDLRTELKGDIQDLRDDRREDRKKLDAVYLSRNTVKMKFGWGWSLASVVIAVSSSQITRFLG